MLVTSTPPLTQSQVITLSISIGVLNKIFFFNMKLFTSYFIPSCFLYSAAVKVVDDTDSIPQYNSSQIKHLHKNSTVIAEGGFSTVYRAKFYNSPSSSSIAAFKVHQSSDRLYQIFHQELNIFLQINNHHPNIVRLFGYVDDRENSEGVLIMENASNGTLHDTLHGRSIILPWSQRVSIAFQVALALDYLHEECGNQIIHGDIKASNVLLDENFNSKLCDFGSARMGFLATVKPSMMMMGSPGYVDPCYLRTGLVSKKSDVYSFGVLVLELVSGREAFCSKKSRMLTTEMRGGKELMVDKKLCGEYDNYEAKFMVEIAKKCIDENFSLRPSMREVLGIMRECVKLST